MSHFNFLKEIGIKNFSILFAVIIITATFSTNIFGQDNGWEEYSGNPIIKPDTSGWNRGGVFAPTVIMFKDTLRMWYMGSTAFDFNADIHIGYAWSLNGINWQQYSENPVFSPRSGEWDYPDIVYPYVIADGDTLRMWYGGGYIRLGDATHREYMQIGYATSVDGINWNRYPDPVIKPVVSGTSWNRDGVLPGGVIKEDGIFKMWFGGGVSPLIPPITSKWSIGYATSSDCIHWDLLPDPVITYGDSSTDFDENVAGHAYVIRTNGGYDMWYYGLSGKIGYASSSDGILWTKYDKNPVLSPTSVSPQWTDSYYEPSVYFDGALFHMYFTGWDEVTDRIATIGYATSELDTSHYPTGIDDELLTQIPKEYKLFQNYPNPFNPSTIISYSIPKQSRVTLKVYDILGNEIKILVNEEKTKGSYKINFNASNLSSGIYFYKLETDNYVKCKKMILLK